MLGRRLQRRRDLLGIIRLENIPLEIEGVAVLGDFRGPFGVVVMLARHVRPFRLAPTNRVPAIAVPPAVMAGTSPICANLEFIMTYL